MSGMGVFCPNCGKSFIYDASRQNLPDTSGSATVVIRPSGDDEPEPERAYLSKIYCPHCGHKFSITDS